MSRKHYVHLFVYKQNHTNQLRTFWFKRYSLISLIFRNDSYNNSLYVLHSILILAVRLIQAVRFPTLSCKLTTHHCWYAVSCTPCSACPVLLHKYIQRWQKLSQHEYHRRFYRFPSWFCHGSKTPQHSVRSAKSRNIISDYFLRLW